MSEHITALLDYEKQLNTANNANMPETIRRGCCNYSMIANPPGNWTLYYCPANNTVLSIAKPGSGASDCIYGNIDHIKKQIRRGFMKRSYLTRYGERLTR